MAGPLISFYGMAPFHEIFIFVMCVYVHIYMYMCTSLKYKMYFLLWFVVKNV